MKKILVLLYACGCLSLTSVSSASPMTAQAVISFSDQTAASGLIATYQPSGFQKSLEMAGLAVGDFDNDGWQDLLVLSGFLGGLPDHLFMNNGDGTFTDEAASWGLTEVHNGKGIGVADYDGDGWLDIYITSNADGLITNLGQHKLYRNNGDRTFSQVATAAGVDFTGTGTAREDGAAVTFGDYDLDGDLDLFVAAFRNPNGLIGNNVLFRNEADGTFSNVTTAANLFPPTDDFSPFSVRFADMDGDRYPELICAGDLGTSHYYQNLGDGTFQDVTVSARINRGTDEMGSTLLDFDNDGLLDWFVSDVFWAVVNKPGNHLYRNLGNHVFDDVAIAAGVDDGSFGWGAVAIDVDHDGWVDILNTNGTYLDPMFLQDPTRLFLNNGDGTFSEVAQSVGLVHLNQGRGMVNFDYDNDGDQDIVIASALNAPLQLFRNDLSGTSVNWLRVFLGGDPATGIAPNGYGARVKIQIGGVETTRYVSGSDNHVSQSELSAHFGLGSATQVDVLTITWPNQATTVMNNVTANQTLTIDAPSLTLAMTEIYNDSGNLNPVVLTSTDRPVIGSTWDAQIDTTTIGFVSLTAFFVTQGQLEFPLSYGVLLIDITQPLLVSLGAVVGADLRSTFSFPIPSDVSTIGQVVHSQGVCFGTAGGIRALTNGLRLTGGI